MFPLDSDGSLGERPTPVSLERLVKREDHRIMLERRQLVSGSGAFRVRRRSLLNLSTPSGLSFLVRTTVSRSYTIRKAIGSMPSKGTESINSWNRVTERWER